MAPAAQGHWIARTLPTCVARPEQTEGPFFVDAELKRPDIRSDPSTGRVSEGVPLTLRFNLSQISGGTCSALPGALVDVWQCDAAGVYSGVSDDDFPAWNRDRKFLRGHQRTDENGALCGAGRSTTNADDRIYRDGGETLMAQVSETGSGYAATFDLGLDLTDAAVGRADGPGGGRRG